MFVCREEYYLDREAEKAHGDKADKLQERLQEVAGIAEVEIAKFRQGETGTEKLRFNGPHQKFENLVWGERR
jgi:replicative DNA helicase